MSHSITLAMDITIYNAKAFARAAQDRAIADGLAKNRKDARINLECSALNLEGCAIMLIDPGVSPPGCSIEQTDASDGEAL